MAGIDKETGRVIDDGWTHTVQSVEKILTTRFGERVERRLFGAILPHLLGENLTPNTWLRFLASIPQSLTVREVNGILREPRFTVINAVRSGTSPETVRKGRIGIDIGGIYRPRGHLGDPTPEGVRRIAILPAGLAFIVEPLP